MTLDLSFWRVVLLVSIAKSGTWGKRNETWLLHVGTFSDGANTAVSIVIWFLSIQLGVINKGR